MEIRTVSVKELVKMFVAISYLQEQRIIKYGDIYDFINDMIVYTDVEFNDLIDEALDTLDELESDGTLSRLYPNRGPRLYRVNDKINIFEISKYPEDYLKDMNKAFFDIIDMADELSVLKLTLSNTKNKSR